MELTGNHIVSREAVLQQFARDRGRSVLRIPLDARRSALEELSWVESASVQRILPNRIRVEITERTPIAFLRNGTELALIDAHGVILDRPRGEDLQFPIVTGLSESMPREERGKRMQTYQEFVKDIDLVRAGSSDRVSEIDLANPKDLRAVMTGIASPNDPQAVTIQFGAERLRRQIPHGGREFRAVAGQQWPRALHRFAIFAAGDPESGHQRGDHGSENRDRLHAPGAGLAKKDKYLVGLDIGSTKTCVLIAEIDDEQVRFLALGAAESKGSAQGT